jgi:hypothetical protein
MILRELFYFNNTQTEMSQDDRYDADHDDSVMKKRNKRKIRLTLKQLNRIRRAADLHELEHSKDMEFVSKMYAAPSEEAAAPA